jgi:hypothetical protein
MHDDVILRFDQCHPVRRQLGVNQLAATIGQHVVCRGTDLNSTSDSETSGDIDLLE